MTKDSRICGRQGNWLNAQMTLRRSSQPSPLPTQTSPRASRRPLIRPAGKCQAAAGVLNDGRRSTNMTTEIPFRAREKPVHLRRAQAQYLQHHPGFRPIYPARAKHRHHGSSPIARTSLARMYRHQTQVNTAMTR